jgi:ABC-type multidrug transport system ATPase subunit
LQYLNKSDHIIVLNDGEIIEQGSFEDLSKKEKGNLSELLKKYTTSTINEDEEDKENNIEKVQEIKTEKKNKINNNSKIIKEEERTRGTVR